jgi:hypothetical protein
VLAELDSEVAGVCFDEFGHQMYVYCAPSHRIFVYKFLVDPSNSSSVIPAQQGVLFLGSCQLQEMKM